MICAAANALRREAERAGDRNELLGRLLIDAADRLELHAPPHRLAALENAINCARREASRAGELDVDEQLALLHEVIVERRRRESRAAMK
jgi:hypothetical protein